MSNKKFFIQIGVAALVIVSLRELYKWKIRNDVEQAKKKQLDESKKGVAEMTPAITKGLQQEYAPQVIQGGMAPTINDFQTGEPYVRIPVAQFDVSATPREFNQAIF